MADAGAAPDAAEPLEPEPAATYPDLVFRVYGQPHPTVFHVATREPDLVRALEPASEPVDSGPIALLYSPDGRKLIARSHRVEGPIEYHVVYPCRDPGCNASRAELLMSTHVRDPAFVFAPDSGGLYVQVDGALDYVRLGPEGVHSVLRVPGVPGRSRWSDVQFVAGGRGLLLNGHFLDLRTPESAARVPEPIVAGNSAEPLTRVALSPDGEHIAFEPSSGAYFPHAVIAASALLAGQRTARQLGTGQRVLHASAERVVVSDGLQAWSERWDGSDPVPLPLQLPGLVRGCGDRLVFAPAIDVAASLLLDSLAPSPVASPLPLASFHTATFYDGCERVRLSRGGQCAMIDLASGLALDPGFDCADFVLPTGELRTWTPTRYDAFRRIGDAQPEQVWAARSPFFTDRPLFAWRSAAVFVASPLEDSRRPGLYQIDLSDPDRPRERRLLPEVFAAQLGALSPDDRFLAYSVARAEVAAADPVATGLFELDLQTGARQRLAPVLSQRLGAALVEPIPGRRAVLLTGRFASDQLSRAYVCDLDARTACVEQLNGAQSTWPVLAYSPLTPFGGVTSVEPVFSRERSLIALNVATPDGPGIVVQPLRMTPSDPPAPPLAVLIDRSYAGAYVATQRHQPIGFTDELGLIYSQAVDAIGFTQSPPRELFALDLSTGQSRPIAAPPGGLPPPEAELERYLESSHLRTALHVFERRGQVVVGRDRTEYGQTLVAVEPGSSDEGTLIARSAGPIETTWLPNDDFLVYSVAGASGRCELHVHELATHVDRALRLPAEVLGSGCPRVHPYADGSGFLLWSDAGHAIPVALSELTARGPDEQRELAVRAHVPGTWLESVSRDGRVLLWREPDGGGYHRVELARPERKRRLRLNGADAGRVAMGADGRYLLLGTSADEPWYLLDARTDSEPVQLPVPGDTYPALDPSGQYATFASDSALWLVRLADPSHAYRLGDLRDRSWLELSWIP